MRRKRATLTLRRGHPCRGCCSVAYRGEISCPLLGPELASLRLRASWGDIALEYVEERANLTAATIVDQSEGRYIPTNLCRTIRRKSPTAAAAYLLLKAIKRYAPKAKRVKTLLGVKEHSAGNPPPPRGAGGKVPDRCRSASPTSIY